MFASIGWLLVVVVVYYQGDCVGSAVLQGMHDLKVAVEALDPHEEERMLIYDALEEEQP